MPTLFDIGDELAAVQIALDDEELTPEERDSVITAWLEAAGPDLEQKLDGYCALIRERTAYAESRKAHAEAMLALAKADDGRVKVLKERLQWFLGVAQRDKVETERFKIAVVANGGKQPLVLPDDPMQLAAKWQKVTYSPDTTAIREALEAGQRVPGCSLGERGKHISIR